MSRRTVLAACAAMTASLALAGCLGSGSSDGKPELKVSGAYMPEPVDAEMAGGFLTVSNSGPAADKLTSVTSSLSSDITIHETKNQKMQRATSFDVPANGTLDLERGGSHIMFMGLKEKPKPGQKVPVELHFEKTGTVKVELPVKERTYNPKHH
ncbi:hypothetical protein GCM10020367_31880 [Streptomyces sannanensis]|uniref:Copper chaperone PCu(A)C n=1 Tax=Streptomyces sannanensis TaxID=285536 RepID=A0ABP6SCL2_9ACTN